MQTTDNVRDIITEYSMTITGRSQTLRRDVMPYKNLNLHSYYAMGDDMRFSYEEELVDMITVDMPIRSLTKMADALCEINNLMRDPETAKLLMEARFINRLKGNR